MMEVTRSLSAPPVICYITLADNSVVQVEVKHRAKGQEVLDKICRMLGILEEAEYFGIQFIGRRNELLWINNRNKLSRQIPSQPPYHFYFKVKYFVPPEDLLLEGTRLQFYHNVVHQLKDGFWDSDTSLSIQARLIGLMAYVQFGKYNQNTTPCKYACFWPDTRGEIPAEAVRIAASFHQTLEGQTVSQAQYELLRIVHNDVPCYGTYFYEVKNIFEHRLYLGVAPEHIIICNPNFCIIEKIPYCRVHTVDTSSRVVTLNLLEDDASVKGQNYQLGSPRLANALHRAVTEVYAFFRCDSVRKEVLTETRKDIREAMGFHHNDKEYAFDVRFTFREVYDRARRRLYHCTTNITQGGSPSVNLCDISGTSTIETMSATSSSMPGQKAAGDCLPGLRKELSSRTESLAGDEEVQEVIQQYITEMSLCRVCMDAPISRVFIPCGHIICCQDCADRVEECSICRQAIEIRHHCFLPWNTDFTLDNHMQLCRQRTHSERFEIGSTTDDLPRTASAPICQLYSMTSNTPMHSSLEGTSTAPIKSPQIVSALRKNSPHTPRASSPTSLYSSPDNPISQQVVHDTAVQCASTPIPINQPVNTDDSARVASHRSVHVTWQLSNED